MSIYIPVSSADTLNVLKNETFSGKVDIRFHDGKLYVCKIEPVTGAIFYGAELILDTIPAAAVYGAQGELAARTIASEVSLNLNFDDWTAQDEIDFTAALLENVGVQDAIVIIEELLSGSVIIKYKIIFASNVLDTDITSAVTTLSDGSTLTTKLQAKGGKFSSVQTTVISSPTVSQQPVSPEILNVTVTPGSSGDSGEKFTDFHFQSGSSHTRHMFSDADGNVYVSPQPIGSQNRNQFSILKFNPNESNGYEEVESFDFNNVVPGGTPPDATHRTIRYDNGEWTIFTYNPSYILKKTVGPGQEWTYTELNSFYCVDGVVLSDTTYVMGQPVGGSGNWIVGKVNGNSFETLYEATQANVGAKIRALQTDGDNLYIFTDLVRTSSEQGGYYNNNAAQLIQMCIIKIPGSVASSATSPIDITQYIHYKFPFVNRHGVYPAFQYGHDGYLYIGKNSAGGENSAEGRFNDGTDWSLIRVPTTGALEHYTSHEVLFTTPLSTLSLSSGGWPFWSYAVTDNKCYFTTGGHNLDDKGEITEWVLQSGSTMGITTLGAYDTLDFEIQGVSVNPSDFTEPTRPYDILTKLIDKDGVTLSNKSFTIV